MKEKYATLKKMFMALDRNLDGFVDIEDLKSVLCKFTIPLSDQLFAQLMERYGKAYLLLVMYMSNEILL